MTFVFLLCIHTRFNFCSIISKVQSRLIGYVFLSSHGNCFGLQVVFLIFRPHRPSQRNFAVLGDDFDVVRVGGETLILMDRFPDFLGDGAVHRIHLLWIRGRSRLVLLVFLGVVRGCLLVVLIPRGCCHHQGCAKNQRTQRQKQSTQLRSTSVHFYSSF